MDWSKRPTHTNAAPSASGPPSPPEGRPVEQDGRRAALDRADRIVRLIDGALSGREEQQ